MNLTKKVRTKQKPTSNSTIDTNNTVRAPTAPLNHLFIKDKKTNHFKNTSITKYFCSTSPNNISLPTNSIPHNGVYTNEPHLDKHTTLVIASTQTTKTPSASLRKRLSPSHLPTSTNMLSSDT